MLTTQELRLADLPALGPAAAALTGAIAALVIPVDRETGIAIAALCGLVAIALLLTVKSRSRGAWAAYMTVAALVWTTAQCDIARDERELLIRHDPDTAIVSFRGVVALIEETGGSRVERLWCERVRLDLADTTIISGNLRIRLTMPLAAASSIRVGDAIACAVRIETVQERQRNSVRELMWSLRTLIWADARLVDDASLVVANGEGGVRATVHDVRQSILHRLAITLSPDAAAIAGALLIGSREALSSEFRSDLQVTGLAHLFALSGLNTGLIVSLCWMVLAWLFVPRRARYVILLGVLICYTLLGLSVPSLFRSAVMAGLWILGRLLAKASHPANLLLFAFAVELFFWPLHLLDAGFLLSYLSMAGILTAYVALMKPFQDLLAAGKPGMRRKIADTLSSTFGAQLATAPVAALLFSRVPGLAIFANVVAIPVFSLLLVLVLLLLITSPVSSALAAPFAQAIEAIVWGFAKMSSIVADVPGAGHQLTGPMWCAVAAFAAQCAAIVMFLRARRLAGALLTLIGLNLMLWPGFFSKSDMPTVRLYGSGNESIALYTSGDFAFLSGFGAEWEGERNAALLREELLRNSTIHVDAAVVTSEKAHVVGGALAILDQLSAGVVVDFSTPRETMTAFIFRAALLSHDIELWRPSAGDAWSFTNAQLDVVWPPRHARGSGCAYRVVSGSAISVFVSGVVADSLLIGAIDATRDAPQLVIDIDNGVVLRDGNIDARSKVWMWEHGEWRVRPSDSESLMRIWSLPGHDEA
ncbi:MAG: ComEC/Rec2 family competence protein [bacterium]|nr:ComEC/Rec2 family competence protein [bacterium]